MKTSLSHLPESKQQELLRVTKLIVETADPEKVILYGSYATGEWQEERYTEKHMLFEFISDYDILVVTKDGDKRQDYEITDKIVNRSRYRVPINVITHDIGYINNQLAVGQYFFSDIIKEGIVLFNADNTNFEEPKKLSVAEIGTIARNDFNNWFNSANEFLIDALHAFNRNSFKKAAFELHQAAERLYNTVILVFTGYKPKTHNLDKLRSFTKKFSRELYEVFPQNIPEEEHLFSLLQKGYIDARYNDNYVITKEELNFLIEKVKNLQSVTDRICRERIAFLNN